MLHPILPLSHAPLPSVLSQASTRDRGTGRRRWTAEEVSALTEALATLRTSDIAQTIGVNPKALRSMLRRNGISLRVIREHVTKGEIRPGIGLLLRRTNGSPSVTFGAAALTSLPDGACRWPLGDPAMPEFSFCKKPRLGRHSYCEGHLTAARTKKEDNHAA